MKIAKTFLATMYLHLIVSIALIVGVISTPNDDLVKRVPTILICYLIFVIAVHLFGWFSAIWAFVVYSRRKPDELMTGWKALKIWSIPFYILNFVFSVVIWFLLVAGSRGIMIVFVWIPVYFTCSMIVQAGIWGVCSIAMLRKDTTLTKQPGMIHYFLQLFAVLDIISTIVVLQSVKRQKSM